jgi:hypothetical protein
MRLREELKQLNNVLVERTKLAEDRAADKKGHKTEPGIIQSELSGGWERKEGKKKKKNYTVPGCFCPTSQLDAAGLPGPTDSSLRAQVRILR